MRTTRLLSLTAVLLTAAAHLSAQATRTWVSGVGDDANPCSRTAPCKTFAGAISKTAAGGEIDALDPGGFGALTITKSIFINGGPGPSGVLVAGTPGITVAAGPNDVVILKDLDFNGIYGNGASSGTDAIRFFSGGTLVVEHCHIFGFNHRGISIESSNDGAKAYISNTLVFGQANNGIIVNPPSGSNTVTLSNVEVANSAGVGLGLNPGSIVHVLNSAFSHNGQAGVVATGTGALSLDSTFISGNSIGLQLTGGAVARLSNVNVVGNAVGFDTSGGILNSFGNNHTTGNADGVQPTVNNHLSPL